MNEVEELKAVLARAALALQHTHKYCGEDMLPAIEGWSWYDSLNEIRDALGYDPTVWVESSIQ